MSGQPQGQQFVDWWRGSPTAEIKSSTYVPTMLLCHITTLGVSCTSQGRRTLINGKWGILKTDGSHGMDGVMTGRTLVDLEKPTVPVRILNLTDKEKWIKKRASIAVCEPVQSVLSLKENPTSCQATRAP